MKIYLYIVGLFLHFRAVVASSRATSSAVFFFTPNSSTIFLTMLVAVMAEADMAVSWRWFLWAGHAEVAELHDISKWWWGRRSTRWQLSRQGLR